MRPRFAADSFADDSSVLHKGCGTEGGGSLYEDDSIHAIALDVEFAWGISSEELLELCKKYHVDMRIYAFERGMEFNLEIEIIDGKITKDSYLAFKDYIWECICPNLGG